MYPPLNLPYEHNSYKNIALPKIISPERFTEMQELHKIRNDDIFIATYQKSGTTWLQHIVNQMFDEPQGKGKRIDEAAPWISYETQHTIDSLKSPRIMKTHAKWDWIPKSDDVKYIYCYRNPKDVAVSYYHHMQFFGYFNSSSYLFKQYFEEIFMKKDGAVFGYYFDHVSDWLKQRDKKNILFVTYEDLVEDLEREMKKLKQFFNLDIGDEKLAAIADNSTFKSMQNNNKVDYKWFKKSTASDVKFLRKGKVGDWVNYLTEEQSKEIEVLVDELLIPLGAKIRYEL